MKKIITAAMCLLLVATALTGCGKKVVSTGTTSAKPTEAASPTASQEETTVNYEPKSTDPLLDLNDVPAQDLSKVDENYQSAAPVEGEEVAVIHTGYGDISFKFFPEVAPMAVENFKALAKAGRYDNTIIHRIFHPTTSGISGIQGGDYTKFNGTGGESAFGTGFGYETSEYLSNTRGSVAMAHSSLPDSNGSQFYINQGDNSALDGGYTIFGQVYDGLDVLDAIYAVECSGETPLTEIVVTSIEIKTY